MKEVLGQRERLSALKVCLNINVYIVTEKTSIKHLCSLHYLNNCLPSPELIPLQGSLLGRNEWGTSPPHQPKVLIVGPDCDTSMTFISRPFTGDGAFGVKRIYIICEDTVKLNIYFCLLKYEK